MTEAWDNIDNDFLTVFGTVWRVGQGRKIGSNVPTLVQKWLLMWGDGHVVHSPNTIPIMVHDQTFRMTDNLPASPSQGHRLSATWDAQCSFVGRAMEVYLAV